HGMLAACLSDDCPEEPADVSIELWDLTKGRIVRTLTAQSTSIRPRWTSNDLIVASSRKGTGGTDIDVWDARTFESLHSESHYCAYPQVDPSGRRVLITGCDGAMTLIDF